MFILRIEHTVMNYDGWKQAFDSDPAGRQRAGVRNYRIMRSCDNPNMVMIDLEFESVAQAEGLLASLRTIWGSIHGKVIVNPRAQIAELVEMKSY